MNPPDLSRLHGLRMETTAAGYRMDAMRPRFDRLRDRHENGTAPRAVSAFQLFQTPPELAERMADLADIQPGQTVLEPSAGLGRLLRPIMERRPGRVVAFELSPDLAGALADEFPRAVVSCGDFLRVPVQGFDRVVMNPPFHMRADVRHVMHARQFLKPGGVLVGLCMAGRHREAGIRPFCDHWETIPAGTFRREGTGVETVLFRITN